uniref:Uncharacterized protein n=1 Tax=Anguilla anguilla TaxID=7936 RepID=A0A0E9USK1_ANGAN
MPVNHHPAPYPCVHDP